MASPAKSLSLYPEVAFPEDPGLDDLPRLFNAEWVWRAYCRQFGRPSADPSLIRVRQFAHSLGRVALASYEIEWPLDEYLPSQLLAIKLERGKPVVLFQYPEDYELPGLSEAARPEGALDLLNRHVLAVGAQRARVELVRYRPASRAVLRHSVGRVRFYVRVVRPHAVAPLLAGHELIGQSGFVAPRLAGHWVKGGVVWFSEAPGENLRRCIQAGNLPDSDLLLDNLQTLWSAQQAPEDARPFNLSGAYSRAKRSLAHNARGSDSALRSLRDAVASLDPFVRSWRPAGVAHNDFYDDQMLVLPDGRIALVDFEEAGPGDPMLDVGNFLAHLQWASCLGRQDERDGNGAFSRQFRRFALDRFHWHESDLAFREAVCLFRICTNAIRRPQGDWRSRLEAGLSLVNETLG